jgi:hypothetical protein
MYFFLIFRDFILSNKAYGKAFLFLSIVAMLPASLPCWLNYDCNRNCCCRRGGTVFGTRTAKVQMVHFLFTQQVNPVVTYIGYVPTGVIAGNCDTVMDH